MNDNHNDEDEDFHEYPPFAHPWREFFTFMCFLIAIIWLLWKAISWLIQAL